MPNPTTTTTTVKAAGASIGSQGTTTVDGNVYTTVVVASYVTVAAQPTTFYENGIAYIASYAGQSITVTDCPCTRSAKIVFMTTTLCSACDGGSGGSATASNGGPSVATASTGETVVFTGSAGSNRSSAAAGLQTLLIGGVIVVLAGMVM